MCHGFEASEYFVLTLLSKHIINLDGLVMFIYDLCVSIHCESLKHVCVC